MTNLEKDESGEFICRNGILHIKNQIFKQI
jgi:hypothetical protein